MLKAGVFAPGESCPADSMYILVKGRILFSGHVYKVGDAWGHDVIIRSKGLRYRFAAIATVYVWTYSIDGSQLRALLAKHPAAYERLRRIEARWSARRLILRTAEEAMQAAGKTGFHGRNHFLLARHPREIAAQMGGSYSGFETAADAPGTPTALSSPSQPMVHSQLDQLMMEQRRNTDEIAALRKEMRILLAEIRSPLMSELRGVSTAPASKIASPAPSPSPAHFRSPFQA